MARRSFDANVEPSVLVWARESIGLEIEEVEESLGLPKGRISEWEKGGKKPPIDSPRRVAKLYRRPLVASLLPGPPEEPSIDDFRTLPDERALPPSEKTRMAIRRAWRLQSIARDLGFSKAETFPLNFEEHNTSENPEDIADAVRSVLTVSIEDQYPWGSATESLQCWKRSIETKGVLVLQIPMEMEDARAFSSPPFGFLKDYRHGTTDYAPGRRDTRVCLYA